MIQNGNNVYDNTLLSIIMKLKQNIMTSTHVADLVRVSAVNDTVYTCELFDGSKRLIVCLALENLNIGENDICLVLYCDNDFRLTLSNYIKTSKIISQSSIESHSLSYGIIIGIIYKHEQNQEEE